jgi:hypothetical protein
MADFFPNPVCTTPTVGLASTALAAQNADRIYIYMVNPTAVDLWVMFGAAAEVGKGFLLAANNGSLTFSVDSEKAKWMRNAINAIDASGVGGRVIAVTEVTGR